ncbi:alpha/beta fold hydrolase [Uliginosibacterium sp. H3]|uniref:Alpha/beta fold hydrolase n=1 Tax=Uliginosibacterium silvisoli TaxID=3114758 RepID=A0ABU6K4T6_9RHOO|nr:alpha/beta fold hydrolase [Uliginosibacterium sp. H3]
MKSRMRGKLRALSLLTTCLVTSLVASQAAHAELWERGRLILSKTITVVPKAAINAALAAQGPQMAALVGPAQCDVRIDAIVFQARGPRNEPITSSGAVLTPVGDASCTVNTSAPVIAFDHGTEFRRSFSMANPTGDQTSAIIGWYAAKGYVVVAPDYHGYGGSTLPYHAYLHAASEADATVDALRASRKVLGRYGLKIGKLFVTGYSHGGHASMATTRALETRYRGEFPLVAAAPMSGPYALEETFVFGASNATLAGTAVGAFAMIGLNRATHAIYGRAADIFQPAYAPTIESYFPGPLEASELYAKGVLPLALSDLFKAPFLETVRSNPDSAVRRVLRENSLIDGWTPQVPMALCGGARDPLVPFFNTLRAQQAFNARGARVAVIEADQAFGLPPFASEDDYKNYHARTIFPLCAIATRKQLFDVLK